MALRAAPNDIAASPVTDVAVTIYRNPHFVSAELDLNRLNGFAFVTETRTVSIPAGESRIRFEGVADGIEPASAILTGLPDGLIEKNHDAKVLSPSALVAASVGHPVTFVRKDPRSGKTTEVPGTLLADADGVVFQADSGEIEALRCSGLPETFDFEPTDEVHATPILSALVRAPRPVQAQVRLSYLARGFEWKADYSAVVSPDGKTLSLGAWVTLANSNSVSFKDAQAKVVAGAVNRSHEPPEPVDPGHPIRAQCWPRGSTSDKSKQPNIVEAQPLWDGPGMIRAVDMSLVVYATATLAAPAREAMFEEVVVTGEKRAKARTVKEEQLGDLKLYRVPDRTSVVSRQIKQVRLLDRTDIPVEVLYRAQIEANNTQDNLALTRLLRTRNTDKNNLGLALPAGQVSTFATEDDTQVLLQQADFTDTAVNQDLEFNLGDSDDVQLSADTDVRHRFSRRTDAENHIDISNAKPEPVQVEIALQLDDGEQIIGADPLPTYKNGLPVFKVTVPANGRYTIRYQASVP